MVDNLFEQILFEDAPKDNIQQAAENLEAAKKASAEANKNADKAKASSNAANNLAAKALGLKDGETLKPADVLNKLKSDPSIFDNIANDGNLLNLLKMKKEDVLALKEAPSLKGAQNAEGENAEGENAEAAPEQKLAKIEDANLANDPNWKTVVDALNQLISPQQQQNAGGQQ